MPENKIFSKIRNTKFIYAILIIGTVIMLISSFSENKPISPNEAEVFSEEEKLCEILSKIDGAGKVSVMITYYSSGEKDIAYETKSDKKRETSSGYGTESIDEKAVMAKSEPVVLREIYPTAKGVVVIASGASSPGVKQAICDAVAASTGIATHKICILTGNRNSG